MMMKGLTIIPSIQVHEENMSNLTSASGGDQASVSTSSQQQSSFASPNPSPAAAKKKRNLPGNPDPEAEVVALSPKSLMATNRFVCEICSKGFQRDQNLQLHRRGHNLPWKLKQRSSKDQVRKKVYVCPEASCVHHDSSRALGDLTGIKKHFSRKHGEKKWKCDKCSKKYAVQSDWKAHSKICGTREYRCDCGTLFSRRDSFITHRAFCDALAEESRRAITGNPVAAGHHPLFFSSQPMSTTPTSAAAPTLDPLSFAAPLGQFPHPLPFKRENLQQEFNMMRPDIPPWLACHQQQQQQLPTSLENQQLTQDYSYDDHGQNPCIAAAAAAAQSTTAPYQAPAAAAAPSAHMSATALLQKAAQMGATMSKPSHHGQNMATALHSTAASSSTSSAFGVGSSSYQDLGGGGGNFVHQDMMLSPLSTAAAAAAGGSSGFDGSSFREAFGGMLKREDRVIGTSVSNGGGNDGMTRDFLGLQRPFSQREILSLAGLDHFSSSSSYEQQPPHKKQRS